MAIEQQAELPITSLSEEEINKRLATVEGAQKLVDELLLRLKEQSINKGNNDGSELFLTDGFREASRIFNYVICTLPKEVASISVNVRFPEIKGSPKTNRDIELDNLWRLLGRVVPEGLVGEQGNVCFEFVVLPLSMPEELMGLSHGSEARRLSHKVRETLRLDRSSELNVLVIKPYGAAEGEASIPYIKAIKYHVPLAQIESIKLNREQKPLTPWLEHDGRGGSVVREVES